VERGRRRQGLTRDAMASAHEELEHYRRDVAALLSALDSEVAPEALAVLERQVAASFGRAAQALTDSRADGHGAFALPLAEVRGLATLARDEVGRAQARIGNRLGSVARARRALAQLDSATTGDSCDVSG
jgi:hypothetical protein